MVNLKDDQAFKYVDMLNHSFNEELDKLKTKIKKPDIKIIKPKNPKKKGLWGF